jgi:predicted small lipoprotein YifL
MIRRSHILISVLILVLLIGATGCGQTGPLTLPSNTANGDDDSDDENE